MARYKKHTLRRKSTAYKAAPLFNEQTIHSIRRAEMALADAKRKIKKAMKRHRK